MAKKKVRQVVTMVSSEGSHRYSTVKNPRNTTDRLELKKYDPKLKKHVIYKEKK